MADSSFFKKSVSYQAALKVGVSASAVDTQLGFTFSSALNVGTASTISLAGLRLDVGLSQTTDVNLASNIAFCWQSKPKEENREQENILDFDDYELDCSTGEEKSDYTSWAKYSSNNYISILSYGGEIDISNEKENKFQKSNLCKNIVSSVLSVFSFVPTLVSSAEMVTDIVESPKDESKAETISAPIRRAFVAQQNINNCVWNTNFINGKKVEPRDIDAKHFAVATQYLLSIGENNFIEAAKHTTNDESSVNYWSVKCALELKIKIGADTYVSCNPQVASNSKKLKFFNCDTNNKILNMFNCSDVANPTYIQIINKIVPAIEQYDSDSFDFSILDRYVVCIQVQFDKEGSTSYNDSLNATVCFMLNKVDDSFKIEAYLLPEELENNILSQDFRFENNPECSYTVISKKNNETNKLKASYISFINNSDATENVESQEFVYPYVPLNNNFISLDLKNKKDENLKGNLLVQYSKNEKKICGVGSQFEFIGTTENDNLGNSLSTAPIYQLDIFNNSLLSEESEKELKLGVCYTNISNSSSFSYQQKTQFVGISLVKKVDSSKATKYFLRIDSTNDNKILFESTSKEYSNECDSVSKLLNKNYCLYLANNDKDYAVKSWFISVFYSEYESKLVFQEIPIVNYQYFGTLKEFEAEHIPEDIASTVLAGTTALLPVATLGIEKLLLSFNNDDINFAANNGSIKIMAVNKSPEINIKNKKNNELDIKHDEITLTSNQNIMLGVGLGDTNNQGTFIKEEFGKISFYVKGNLVASFTADGIEFTVKNTKLNILKSGAFTGTIGNDVVFTDDGSKLKLNDQFELKQS